MKIDKINCFTEPINKKKQAGASYNNFEQIIDHCLKSKSLENESASEAQSASKAEGTNGVSRSIYLNVHQINGTGFKELVKDAFINIGSQILQEINSICADETGENINMKLLDELLDLYKNHK